MPTTKVVIGTVLVLLLGGDKEVLKPMDMNALISRWKVYAEEGARHRFDLVDVDTKQVEKVIYEDSDAVIEEVRESGILTVNGQVVWDGPKRATITMRNKRKER